MSTEFDVEQAQPLLAVARGESGLTAAADNALQALEAELNAIAAELQVEHVGPGVGMADMNAEGAYRIVVREHEHDVTRCEWGVMVCDAADNCDYRPMWPMSGTGRLRRRQVVEALPELVAGWRAAVNEAGQALTPGGQRLVALDTVFNPN